MHTRLSPNKFVVSATGLILILFSFSMSALAEPNWKPFVSEEGRFSVLMVGTPKYSHTNTDTPVGTVGEYLYSCEVGPLMLDAEYANLPNLAALFGGRSKIYRNVVKEFIDREHATEISFETTVLDAYRGRVMTYETSERFGKLWMLLISRRLYILNASVPKAFTDKSIIDVYLSSFKPIYKTPKQDKGKG